MKKNRGLLLILTLILLLCGGCYVYDYPCYDPYYINDYYSNESRQHRELNRKLDRIDRELEWQAFDHRMDRLNRDLGY